MSDGSENSLARWSRRKLAARREQEPAAPELEQASGDVAENDDPVASCPEPNLPETKAAELEGAETVEPLPRLDDLTAESDVAAFLKKGVPMALKHAALRKVWSLDPGIRDFVGPSEYAWDFNKVASMGGFGPLDANETVVGFLSKAARAVDTLTEPEPGPSHEQSADALPDAVLPVENPEKLTTEKSATDEPPAIEPLAHEAATHVSTPVEFRSRTESPDKGSPSELPKASCGPRHGGAMPR
ncbi:DUF3306 domain-containing protein [Sinorhizobium medicae]|nr:DUF3306 domain-containing protein [Sinorhizobium medicae]MDX0586918.1 DUF3306 domain-containing protein [Sinorhizobium medicae]MDX0679652.1 DUF3306 domain-containing protein [Sinorhizobium medicae]MDX0715977.1 DUF3306 domain-containing protein [Sinorhizobium medicae]MDX0845657.1 DUF3306 domain-containing protein [Sinorhizobium medicae]